LHTYSKTQKHEKMEQFKAINQKHQSKVNRAIKALVKYNELNDLRDKASDMGEDREFKKLDNLCGKYFDKYLDIVDELPARERNNIEKSDLY